VYLVNCHRNSEAAEGKEMKLWGPNEGRELGQLALRVAPILIMGVGVFVLEPYLTKWWLALLSFGCLVAIFAYIHYLPRLR
jgi:uncharacterized membrane protein YphA (DoxX/SURF4 family)